MIPVRSIGVVCTVLAAACATLATIDYRPYDAKAKLYQGEGGAALSVDGVDFWTNGSPPGKFSILGIATHESGAGYSDVSVIRLAVVEKAKQVGGSAVIQISNNTSFSGAFRSSPSMYLTSGPKQLKFAIVKYEN